jgi:hypothetical protein
MYTRDPLFVILNGAYRESDQSCVTFAEFILFLGEGCDFCAADWRKVAWMGKKYSPLPTDVRVEVEVFSW